ITRRWIWTGSGASAAMTPVSAITRMPSWTIACARRADLDGGGVAAGLLDAARPHRAGPAISQLWAGPRPDHAQTRHPPATAPDRPGGEPDPAGRGAAGHAGGAGAGFAGADRAGAGVAADLSGGADRGIAADRMAAPQRLWVAGRAGAGGDAPA